VPISDAKAYLAENKLTKLDDILDELFHPLELPFDSVTILDNYVAVFCILLEMDKGTVIADFVKYELNDWKLPFDPDDEPSPGFPTDSDAVGFYELFCKIQWRFCVPSFEKDMTRAFEVDRILPIAKIEMIVDSGSALIQMIRLHNSYNSLIVDSSMVFTLNCAP